MPQKLSNFASTLLTNALTNSSADLGPFTVTTGEGALFPALESGETLRVVLSDSAGNREVVTVGTHAAASDSFTIVSGGRGQEGTSVLAWDIGDAVTLRWTKGIHDNLVQRDETATTGGSANAYTATILPKITAYETGREYRLTIHAANTGASTINLSGLGAKDIVKNGSEALAGGEMPAGHEAVFRYNGADMVLMNPALSFVYTISTSAPTSGDGADGEFWFEREA